MSQREDRAARNGTVGNVDGTDGQGKSTGKFPHPLHHQLGASRSKAAVVPAPELALLGTRLMPLSICIGLCMPY